MVNTSCAFTINYLKTVSVHVKIVLLLLRNTVDHVHFKSDKITVHELNIHEI
jgi:hypothetical protein